MGGVLINTYFTVRAAGTTNAQSETMAESKRVEMLPQNNHHIIVQKSIIAQNTNTKTPKPLRTLPKHQSPTLVKIPGKTNHQNWQKEYTLIVHKSK